MQKITIDMISFIAESFVSVFNSEPWNDSWTKEQAEERLTDIFNTPKFDGAVEIINGKIAGVIMGKGEQYYNGVHFQILEFWVSKNMRRKGVGSKLLNDFTEHLKSKGIFNTYLITMHDRSTEGFYKFLGYNKNQMLCIMNKAEK